MCRKLVVVNKLSLGSRELGWECFSFPKREVIELTTKQLKDAIKHGTDEVYGLVVNKDTDELEFDRERWFTTNMMNKLHINTLVPIEESDSLANLYYIVVGTHKEENKQVYEVVSSRYEQAVFSEEKVRTLLDLKIISGGAKLEDGKIVVASMEKVKPVETEKKPEQKETKAAKAEAKPEKAEKPEKTEKQVETKKDTIK